MLRFDLTTKAYAPLMASLHAMSFETSWTEEAFRAFLDLPTTVGFINEAGFILCTVVSDEAEILTLCVHPDCRRQGIATALLQKMETYLKEKHIRHFFLDVRASNLPACHLYARNGFEEMNRRRGYYETKNGREDALVLKKEL